MSRRIVLLMLAICGVASAGIRASRAEESTTETPPAAQTAIDQAQAGQLLDVTTDSSASLYVANVGQQASSTPLGLTVEPASEALRSQLSVAEGQGLVVTDVAADSPAAEAGVARFDVILTLDDQPVTTCDEFNQRITSAGANALSLALIRSSNRINATVNPRQQLALNYLKTIQSIVQSYWLGIQASPADGALRSHLRLPADEGLVVTEVVVESPAARAGVMVHDVLILLDDVALRTTEQLTEKLQELKDREVPLGLLRAGQRQTLNVAAELHTEYVTNSPTFTMLNQELVPWISFDLNRNTGGWVVTQPTLYANTTANANWITSLTASSPTALSQQVANLRSQLESMRQTLDMIDAALRTQATSSPSADPNANPAGTNQPVTNPSDPNQPQDGSQQPIGAEGSADSPNK